MNLKKELYLQLIQKRVDDISPSELKLMQILTNEPEVKFSEKPNPVLKEVFNQFSETFKNQ
jgi:hypothetical protein